MIKRRGIWGLLLLFASCGGEVDLGVDGGSDGPFMDSGQLEVDGALGDGGHIPDGGPPDLPDTGPLTCDDPDTWYRDLDGDGHGDPMASVESCDPVEGFVMSADDCDDGCDACHPGATEVCDGRDNDCNGSVDETFTCVPGAAVGCTTSCGTAGMGACTSSCEIPAGAACTPPAETCNGIDDDCDGAVDDGFMCAAGGATVCTTSCGSVGTGECTTMCEAPSAAACTPPAETCNGMDDDCDGNIDQTFACALGASVSCTTSCGTTGSGTCTGSCEIPTGAACTPPAEVCNGIDDDCDGVADDGFDCAAGSIASCTTSCGSIGAGRCSASCEEAPAASCAPPLETCNYADDDCDGLIDEDVMTGGPPTLVPTSADYARPRVVRTGSRLLAIHDVGGQHWFTRLDLEGAVVTAPVALNSGPAFDLGANRSSKVVYASVDTAGDIHVHRFSDTIIGGLFAWSRTIPSDATDVWVAVGTGKAWIYSQNAGGRVQFHTIDMNTGLNEGATFVVNSPRRIAVWSNGLRHHWMAAETSNSTVRWYQREDNGLLATGTILVPEQRLADLAIVGDYSFAPTVRYNGFIVAYALWDRDGTPAQLRYYSRRANGDSTTVVIDSGTVPAVTQFSQMDLDMADGIAQLGVVWSAIAFRGVGEPRVYQLSKRPTGASYELQHVTFGLPTASHEGVSVVRLPDSAGALPDRLFYNPAGNAIASVPIGCF